MVFDRLLNMITYAETLYETRYIHTVIPWYRKTFRQILKDDPSINGVVSTGSSGAILATILLTDPELKSHRIVHIHANKANSHHGKISGPSFIQGNFVFVDDFIESGKSLQRCIDFLHADKKIVHLIVNSKPHHSDGKKLIQQLGIPISYKGQRKAKKVLVTEPVT